MKLDSWKRWSKVAVAGAILLCVWTSYSVAQTVKGNNGVGNGLDPAPPGNPKVNDGPGTGPGNPGAKPPHPDVAVSLQVLDLLGADAVVDLIAADVSTTVKGNNGVGNGLDPAPPGNPKVNDGPGTGPGNPGNKPPHP